MITGYNTDIRHRDVVFHVQTEDKGRANPLIETLVYVGGVVIASERASYAGLLAGGGASERIARLMDRQHRQMIEALRRGELDGKVGGGVRLGPEPDKAPAAPRPTRPAEAAAAIESRRQATVPTWTRTRAPAATSTPRATASGPLSQATGSGPLCGPSATPAAAAAVQTQGSRGSGEIRRSGESLDQVILDYLAAEAGRDRLRLNLSTDAEPVMGRVTLLSLEAISSKTGRPVANAAITVKLISTVAPPATLASGRTAADGGVDLRVSIPQLRRGTAALIVTAESRLGRAEIKYLL